MTMPPLDQSHAVVAAAALAAGGFLRDHIKAALVALPNYLTKRAKASFDAAVAAGKIPPSVARLAIKLKRAVFEWADEEMPKALGQDKMDKALDALEQLPYVGKLVAIDRDGVRDDLQAEYDAARKEVATQRESAEPAAGLPPGPPNPPSPPAGQRVG